MKPRRKRNLDVEKKRFGWSDKDGPEEEFISWWSWNHGSGYIDRALRYLMSESSQPAINCKLEGER